MLCCCDLLVSLNDTSVEGVHTEIESTPPRGLWNKQTSAPQSGIGYFTIVGKLLNKDIHKIFVIIICG